ncbi:MAG: hypothetical protein RMJ84_09050 [Sandaracinaceae bacterium]|nr:hypothetical protein [Sandaracinaceae bacterium]
MIFKSPQSSNGFVRSPLANWNPVRSVLAIAFAFLLFTQVFSRLTVFLLLATMPDAFPQQPEEGELLPPSKQGLLAISVLTLFHALLAGALAARLAIFAPTIHAAVLGVLFTYFAQRSVGALRFFPSWFVVGQLFLPLIGSTMGGWLMALLSSWVRWRKSKKVHTE